MSFVTVDDRWTYSGHRVVVLENDRIRLEIMPELGAKIFRFVHRPSGVDLLWHQSFAVVAEEVLFKKNG